MRLTSGGSLQTADAVASELLQATEVIHSARAIAHEAPLCTLGRGLCLWANTLDHSPGKQYVISLNLSLAKAYTKRNG